MFRIFEAKVTSNGAFRLVIMLFNSLAESVCRWNNRVQAYWILRCFLNSVDFMQYRKFKRKQ